MMIGRHKLRALASPPHEGTGEAFHDLELGFKLVRTRRGLRAADAPRRQVLGGVGERRAPGEQVHPGYERAAGGLRQRGKDGDGRRLR